MRIFIDMDEVIADTYQQHINVHNQKYGTNFTKADCYGKEFWMCVAEKHQQEVRDHAYQKGFFKDIPVIGNAVEVIKELETKHEVFIASAAMQFPNSLQEKSEWLDQHLPFITWKNRILCGHKHILKGDVLIDDRSYNLQHFEGRGIQFTSPHNVHTTDFERADDWNTIASLLL